MEITLDEIYTYLSCPLKYELKYVHGIEGEDNSSIKYRKSIHKTIDYFYYSIMGGRVPTARQMRDKWASIWMDANNEKITKDDLLKERQPAQFRADKQRTRGFEVIHNFHHYNHKDPGIPIAVNHEYRLPIDGVTVIGNFELVREVVDKDGQKRFIEIVDYKTSGDSTDSFFAKHDLNITFASYAFRNLFQAKEDRLTIHYLNTNKDAYAHRGENDYGRMKSVVQGVAEGIAKKQFYPRHTHMCGSCPVREVCTRVKF